MSTAHPTFRSTTAAVTLTLLVALTVGAFSTAAAATLGPKAAHKRAVVSAVQASRTDSNLVRLRLDAPHMTCQRAYVAAVARAVADLKRVPRVPGCARPVLGRGWVVSGDGPRASALKLLRTWSTRTLVLRAKGRTLAVAVARRRPGVWVSAVVVGAAMPPPAASEPAPAAPGGDGESAEDEWNRVVREDVLAEIGDRRTQAGAPALAEDACLDGTARDQAAGYRSSPDGELPPAVDPSACPGWDRTRYMYDKALGAVTGRDIAAHWYDSPNSAAWLNDPTVVDYGLAVTSDETHTWVVLAVRKPSTPPPDAQTTPIG